ncbi:MAG TPA: DUF1743 domain-containing protein [Candidatus Methanomethylia archaeon]|nr:DUF1743 domain-containing protein [Candidatus Methanomethylicia archaeon]
MPFTELHIGIDDTDSLQEGCTTYVAALLVEELKQRGAHFKDYPQLIRLNPNIPWKSRGNGAVCLRIIADTRDLQHMLDVAIDLVERLKAQSGSNPGIAVLKGSVPTPLEEFSKAALHEVLTINDARKVALKNHVELLPDSERRGIIGALAAIGQTLLNADYTYELLAYRIQEMRGKPRRVDPKSVVEMDKLTHPFTFNNIDYETRKILISSGGPGPCPFGIWGENPEILVKALSMLKVEEPIERWVIFRTNQGTDAHLAFPPKRIKQLKPYEAVTLEGVISKQPMVIPGGHVIASISDGTGEVDIAAYEPTGSFREVVKKLTPGDLVKVYGGVRPISTGKFTINLEKLVIVKVAELYVEKNPRCPRCGKRMKSEGKGKGFSCPKCKYRDPKAEKERIPVQRELEEGKVYLPPPRAQRHLTKPLQRYGREKIRWTGPMIEKWHYPP